MEQRLIGVLGRHRDALIAVVLVAVMVAQAITLDEPAWARTLTAATALALLVPLALRRRFPLVLLATLVAIGILGLLFPKAIFDIEAIGFVIVLASYTAGAHTAGRPAALAAAMLGVVFVSILLGDPDGFTLGGILFFSLFVGAPWAAGRVVRHRRASEARMERERDDARAAIADERTRIARELHDVVAHAISVIVLQARGGRLLMDDDPEETRGALTTIERTGQEALVEMRRLVGLLREDDATLALAPQPGLARLQDLVDQVRAAGLPVEVEVEGTPADLPPGVDLSAYRIVQEALTNALRHAGPARARVVLRYAAQGIDVEVRDDGVGGADANGGGHGLAGIRERVAVYGGDIDAGPLPDGGFAVRAHLPVVSAR